MKKIVFMFTALLALHGGLHAEDTEIKKNAIGAGMGFISVPDFEIWADEFDSNADFDRADSEESDNTFARFISYDRMI